MGLIRDNTNTIEVYLTDLGREAFLNNGLVNSIKSFSMSDEDANYRSLNINPADAVTYSGSTTYNVGDLVVTGTSYYMYQKGTGTDLGPPSSYWIEVYPFDPTKIIVQAISTINHNKTRSTSIVDASGTSISDVFVQVSLRGSIYKNKEAKKTLSGVKTDTLRSYVFQEPGLDTGDMVTTYIKR